MTYSNRVDTQAVFFELIRSGLWEKDIQLSQYMDYDLNEVYRLAEEQSVVGLIAAGLEHVQNGNFPKDNVLTFVGQALQIEQKNSAMNAFIKGLFNKMSGAGINALLVKGQGIAQCYDRPLWRSCGDVDLLVDINSYEAAKSLLIPWANSIEEEVESLKHFELNIDGWIVEIHGSLRGNVLKRIDRVIDSIQKDLFVENRYRIWHNDTTTVPLPAPNEDVILVFAHIIQHFTQGGVGLRQICDWIRLLWTFQDVLDVDFLGRRIAEMGLMTEWKVFGALSVDFLGMPTEIIPFYSNARTWHRKASRLISFVMKTGNMGHNRDSSYHSRHSFVVAKTISLWRHISDAFFHFFIFPLDSIKVFGNILIRRSRVALKGICKKTIRYLHCDLPRVACHISESCNHHHDTGGSL